MEKKEPIEFALKSLDNFSIARHNEYHYISSDFAFVNSFTGMETTPFSLDQPYRIKKDVLHSSNKVLPEFSLI